MEDGGWRMEDGGWRMEDGGWRMEEREEGVGCQTNHDAAGLADPVAALGGSGKCVEVQLLPHHHRNDRVEELPSA